MLAGGGNEKSAKLSGIQAGRVKMMVYIISGFCAAWIGQINTARISAAHPASGDGWAVNAIAATVPGGTAMAGGPGTIMGAIVGAFVTGVISDGMTMCGVTECWQKIIRSLMTIPVVCNVVKGFCPASCRSAPALRLLEYHGQRRCVAGETQSPAGARSPARAVG